jgi:hypothetical protein
MIAPMWLSPNRKALRLYQVLVDLKGFFGATHWILFWQKGFWVSYRPAGVASALS